MTDDVARLVLRNNYLQSLALSLAEHNGAADLAMPSADARAGGGGAARPGGRVSARQISPCRPWRERARGSPGPSLRCCLPTPSSPSTITCWRATCRMILFRHRAAPLLPRRRARRLSRRRGAHRLRRRSSRPRSPTRSSTGSARAARSGWRRIPAAAARCRPRLRTHAGRLRRARRQHGDRCARRQGAGRRADGALRGGAALHIDRMSWFMRHADFAQGWRP